MGRVVFCGSVAHLGPWRLMFEVSRAHTITHTHLVGLFWTSDQLVAECRYLYNTQRAQETNIVPLAGFEPAIPAIKQPQTYALDRTVTGLECICFGLAVASHSVTLRRRTVRLVTDVPLCHISLLFMPRYFIIHYFHEVYKTVVLWGASVYSSPSRLVRFSAGVYNSVFIIIIIIIIIYLRT
jgi:hypothetical protein